MKTLSLESGLPKRQPQLLSEELEVPQRAQEMKRGEDTAEWSGSTVVEKEHSRVWECAQDLAKE